VRIKDGESWVGFANLPRSRMAKSHSIKKKSETKGPSPAEEEEAADVFETGQKRTVGFA
jgi:hypothetical protein